MKTQTTMKICLVGDARTGKTALIRQLIGAYDSDECNYIATIGAEMSCVEIDEGGNSTINVYLWEVAGNDKFSGLREGYYINADGAIILYDYDPSIWRKDLQRVIERAPIAEYQMLAVRPREALRDIVGRVLGRSITIRNIRRVRSKYDEVREDLEREKEAMNNHRTEVAVSSE